MRGPFMRDAWDSRSPLSYSAIIPAGFHSQQLWGLPSLALEHWAREPGVGQEPLLLRENLQSWSTPIFNHHVQLWASSIQCLCPSCQSRHGFFKSLVMGLLCSYVSGGSPYRLFRSLSVVLTWLWEDRCTASSSCRLDQEPQAGNLFSYYWVFKSSFIYSEHKTVSLICVLQIYILNT